MKKTLTLIFALLCANVLFAQNFYQGGVKYTVSGTNTVSVTGHDSSLPDSLVIPSTVTNEGVTYTVTFIKSLALHNCNITSVTIPNTVTAIGTAEDNFGAFETCTNLTSVTIPSSVTLLGNHAFYNCSNLTTVAFEENSNLTTIGENAFFYCTSLTSIEIPNSVTIIGEVTFASCNSLTTVTFEENSNLTTIGNYAFHDCNSLTSIEIPNSVITIGNLAFYYCTSLTSIEIPNSVITIGEGAFSDCDGLTSIEIPNSVTTIGDEAFIYCSNLTSVTSFATTPPTIESSTFRNIPSNAVLTVVCEAYNAYSIDTNWANAFDTIVAIYDYNVNALTNNEAFGSVSVQNSCENIATITANANNCYEFVSWNDGNTENPRTIALTSDTTFTATFTEINFDTTLTATICEGQTYIENGFNVNEAGTYTQTLQTEFGCDSTITLILNINSSLIDVEITEISFYPNPTNSKITFNQMIERIEAIDLSGKVILTFANAREINIDALPSGAYYLRLTNNDKAIMRKVIKE